jgi:ribonuclease HIII
MPVSSTLSIDELDKLKGMILSKNLKKIPTTNEYELLRIKEIGISITVYKSGKIVYENTPQTMEIMDQIFKHKSEFDYELGSDEVGKGEWYGPLVVVCAALDSVDLKELRKLGVRDSKQLSNDEIRRLSKEIQKRNIFWNPLILSPLTYNEQVATFKKENKNINDLLAWAHSAVIKKLIERLDYNSLHVVIDKFDVEKTYHRLEGIDRNKVTIIQKSKGETEIPVAAASILAKNIFNDEVDSMCKRFGMDFRSIDPKVIPKEILTQISKHHFKNISTLLT